MKKLTRKEIDVLRDYISTDMADKILYDDTHTSTSLIAAMTFWDRLRTTMDLLPDETAAFDYLAKHMAGRRYRKAMATLPKRRRKP